MARIKYTGLVESIRGSIGGTTFQRNAYGFTIKAKPNMVKPNSIGQINAQFRMTEVAQEWRLLSESDRSDWQAWAEANPKPSRLNPDSALSGYNLFLAYNRYRRIAEGALLNAPDFTLRSTGPLEPLIYIQAGELRWETNPTANTGLWNIILYLTPPIPFGREFVNFTPRVIAASQYNTPTVINIDAAYRARIGLPPVAGQFVGIRLVAYCRTTGQYEDTGNLQVEVAAV